MKLFQSHRFKHELNSLNNLELQPNLGYKIHRFLVNINSMYLKERWLISLRHRNLFFDQFQCKESQRSSLSSNAVSLDDLLGP